MGLFKEIYCAECGLKTNVFTRTKLADGNYICSKCTKEIPSYILECVDGIYTLEDFRNLKRHIQKSKEEYEPIFQETHSYKDIHLDAFHGLFYFKEHWTDSIVYFPLSHIVEFDLSFSPNELKEGIIGDKVVGCVLLQLTVVNPLFHVEKIIDDHAKATARTSHFGRKVDYESPKKMRDFLFAFQAAYDSFNEEYDGTDIDDAIEESESVKNALALFMFDRLDDVSLENLRDQRNKLIKAFHPDSSPDVDTKFAQKINEAYEVLNRALFEQQRR